MVLNLNKINPNILKAFILSLILSFLMILAGSLLIKYPLFLSGHFLRFFAYSLVLMLPVLVITSLYYALRPVVDISAFTRTSSLPDFIVYFCFFFLLFFFYNKQKTKEKKRKFLFLAIFIFTIYIIFSISFLNFY